MTSTSGIGPRTGALLARADALAAALERGHGRVPADVAATTESVLAGVRERLALGVDHTVVALVGGTGSGKSSLFNALTGLEYADVGVRRPTTSRVTACVWAHDATALLDWLGVDRDRRIERETALDGETQADLRGLVLLDLPDHDSVEAEHRAVVDRLLPLVDLLVWVVDPQKYADDALHTGYLQHLVGHEGAMLVVLNQVDTVPPARRESLLADVERLLVEDGLVDVGTHALSARTGEGVRAVRGVLATAVAGRGVAELRASAELDDAARALAATVGAAEPDLPVERAVDALVEASGLRSMAHAVESDVRAGGRRSRRPSVEDARLGPVQADRVDLVRAAWLEEVGAALPGPWASAVAAAVSDDATLVRGLDERLEAVAVHRGVPRGPRVLASGAAVLALLGVVAVGLAISPLVLADGPREVSIPPALAAVGALGVAVLLTLLGIAMRRRAGRRRGVDLVAAGRAAVVAAVEENLAAPTRAVLDDHRAVRTAAMAVSDSASAPLGGLTAVRVVTSTPPSAGPDESASSTA